MNFATVNMAFSLHSSTLPRNTKNCEVLWWFFAGKIKTKKKILLHFQNNQSSQPVLTFGKHLKLQSILALEMAFLRRNSYFLQCNCPAPTLISMLKNSPSCCRGKVAPPHCCPLRLDHLRTWPPSLSYSDTIKT